MKFLLNLRYLLALAVAMTVIASCGKDDVDDGGDTDPMVITGCMDEEAENYNPDATETDNNCIYARDQFIGNYNGSMTFQLLTGLDQDTLEFDITPGIDFANEVKIGVMIQGFQVTLKGIAMGDSIFVDDTFPIPDASLILEGLEGQVDVDFSGAVGIAADGLTIGGDLDVLVKTDNQDVPDIATLTGVKE